MRIDKKSCLHCKAPLDDSNIVDGSSEGAYFCCQGCKTVYQLLHQEGLDRFYDLAPSELPPVELQQHLDGSDAFGWLDGRESLGQLTLGVQGVHCSACVWLFEEIFEKEAGAKEILVNATMGEVFVDYDPQRFDLKGFLQKMESFGYRFGERRKEQKRASQALLWRVGVSVALSMNVMIMTISFYLGLKPSEDLYDLFAWVAFGLTTLNVIIGGWPFLRSALILIRLRALHLDLPIAVGILFSYIGSSVSFFLGDSEQVFFDSLSVFISLMLLGRFLQNRSLENNRQKILQDQKDMSWNCQRILVEGEEKRMQTVTVQDVQIGDRLLIPMGSVIPMTLILDSIEVAQLNLAWMTGESELVSVPKGDILRAGGINQTQRAIEGIVTEEWANSELQDLLKRTPITDGRTDVPSWFQPILAWYVPIVFILASIGFLLWIPEGWQRATEVVMALLIVTCPCAFGIAMPLAKELAILRLRQRGVFVQSARFLSKINQIEQIVFDKTGTLTLGVLELENPKVLEELTTEQKRALASMVAQTNHPKAKAIQQYLTDIPLMEGIVREKIGVGVALEDWALQKSTQGEDTVFSHQNEQIAAFQFREKSRGNLAALLQKLRDRGKDMVILSGDRQQKVQKLLADSKLEGITAIGGVSPKEKATWIEEHSPEASLMIGDGLNDSQAFEQAALTATPASHLAELLSRSDLYFLGENIASILLAIDWGKQTQQTQQRAFMMALSYNVIVIGLCFMGWMTPLFAAIAMPISSVAIVSDTFIQQRKLRGKI